MRRESFTTVAADITKIDYNQNDINFILQVCNNSGKYGAGLSGAIGSKWPVVEKDYRSLGHDIEMGSIQISTIDRHLAVVNMIAQYGVRSMTNPHPLDYRALEMCLVRLYTILYTVAKKKKDTKFKIWCPKIGAGLAGGDWNNIRPRVIHWMGFNEFELTFVEFG